MLKHWQLLEEEATSLVKVVNEGTDQELVRHLETMSPDVVRSVATHVARYGDTALHLAAVREKVGGVRAMLGYKVDVNARNELGHSPLYTCLSHNCLLSARLLLGFGADVNEVVSRQTRECLLHRMIKGNRSQAVDVLLEAGATTEATTKDGDTPLHYTARYNRPKMAMALIEKGADINAANIRKETPLHVSITNSNVDVAKVLVKSKANTTVKDRRGMTALHSAVTVNAVELVQLMLMNNSTHVNSKEPLLGRTPLLLACSNSSDKMASLLLSFGADANLTSTFRKSVLHAAASSGKADVLNTVLKHSNNPNALAINNKTPLHNAVVEGHLDIVKSLLKAGVNVNTKDIDGNTALHMASQAGNIQIVSLLLQHRGQVNITNMLQQTALHLASKYGHKRVANILVEAGCNSEIMDTKDKKASDYFLEFQRSLDESTYSQFKMKHQGTIRHRSDFDAGAVAATLRKAMAGFGTDENAVIHCLGNHTCEQRLEIAKAYKTAYGKDLVADIKSELTGDFEEVCVAMLTPFKLLNACELHDAISGAGTDETTIIEVLCTKSNTEIEQIKAAYKQEYGNDLEKDLCGDTSGYFRRLMVSLMAAGRETDDWTCDKDRARADAKKFFEAGEARWGTEEAEINAILCLRSRCHLLQVFHYFKEISGKNIEDSIRSECSGSLQDGYLAIVESIKDTPGFFARRIHDCVQGIGTNDAHLIRIIVTRSEIDMEEIESAYKSKYKKSVVQEIESECGGDYKKMLIACVKLDD